MDNTEHRLGVLTADLSPTLVGLIKHSALDFLIIDAEQTGVTASDCTAVVAALSGSAVSVAIRVPSLDDDVLVEFANTGADELVLPRVKSVRELEGAYSATRFPPQGRRSRQVSPASSYGTDFSRVPKLTVLIETIEAVDTFDEFLASEHFTSAWIGPNDLGDAYAAQGGQSAEKLSAAMTNVLAAAQEAGKSVGLPATDLADVAKAYRLGADMCAIYWEKYVGKQLGRIAAWDSEGKN